MRTNKSPGNRRFLVLINICLRLQAFFSFRHRKTDLNPALRQNKMNLFTITIFSRLLKGSYMGKKSAGADLAG